MKTFNKKLLVTTFLTTLLFAGCMPDSLTKYKKDAPKKEVPVVPTEPVVDDDGEAIPFDEPSYYLYSSQSGDASVEGAIVETTIPGDPIYLPTATIANMVFIIDGSLGDADKVTKFFERCDLMTGGVNAQAASLPAGLSLNASTCQISGKPTTPKSVVTAFCNDGVSPDQASCESKSLVWNSTAGTCSNPDLAYATKTKCEAGFYKWYDPGHALPYRVRMKYHNGEGTVKYVYTTIPLGIYKPLSALSYTQSEKVLLKVSATDATPSYFDSLTPLLTTTITAGAYPKNAMLTSSTGVSGVIKISDPIKSHIGVNKVVPMRVTSTIPFTVSTFVTKSGDSSYVGKIFKIDSANRILYVENISANNKYFLAGDRLCANNTTGVCGTSYPISSIEENYTYKEEVALDNDKQYFVEKFKTVIPTSIFEVGAPIKPLKPITSTEITSTNGLSYSISPSLPCNDPTDPTNCVSFNTSTGEITGTFAGVLSSTEFKITASNPLNEVTTSVYLSAIVPPANISYTNKQIITVNSNALFLEGETVIQPINPPLLDAVVGRVLKKIGNYRMAIETFNGAFSANTPIDNNSSAYQAEKAYIIPYSTCTNSNFITEATCTSNGYAWAPSADVHYNLALMTSTSGSYVADDFVTSIAGSGTGAMARVIFVETDVRDTLYVQYLTGTATASSSAKTFYEDDTLTPGTVVDQVRNSTMLVTLASSASFLKGSDIVSNQNTAAYTNGVSGNILSLSEISKTTTGTYFEKGHILYNHETQLESSVNSTITAVTHNNYFIFERGKKMVLNAAIESGSGLIYSISPALPSGLVLDSLTGIISGVATSASAKKDYLITATNFTGSTSLVASFEVRDFFEVIEKSGASSALMHKVGDYQVNRKCRIDASDIAALSNGKSLDIRCFLDIEEQDLFETDLKLNLFTGPGICQYIRYEPYYFYSWQPHQTVGTSSKYKQTTVIRNGCDALGSSGEIPTADLCEGNYEYYDSTYPNCDEGYLTYYIETYSQASPMTSNGSCTLNNVSSVKVDCGGKRAACISGAVKDVIEIENLEIGKRNEVISTFAGLDKTYTHNSPMTKGDANINLRTANGTVNNQCYSSAAETLTWKNATAAQGNLKATPLASDSNPFYTVTCLDAAYDIKARIRVIVRDWDKSFKIDSNIYNQNFSVPATNMNNNTLDPIFAKPYNDKADWDDAYAGAASTFTPNTCAAQAAANCTIPSAGSPFISSADCTNAGGTVVTPGSCSAGGYTDYRSCVSNGSCSVAASDAGVCAHGAGGTWTPYTWTSPTCRFTNQNQCEFYGGVWAGPQQYKFPMDLLND